MTALRLPTCTGAMGITPRLYAAFGNKEILFRKALDLYEREKLPMLAKALKAPTSRRVAEQLLRGGRSKCRPAIANSREAACASSARSVAWPGGRN